MRQPAVDGTYDRHPVVRSKAQGVNCHDGQDQAHQRRREAVVDQLAGDDKGQDAEGDAERPAVGVADLIR